MSGWTPNEKKGASIQRPRALKMRCVVPASSRIGRTPSHVMTRVSPARQWKYPNSGFTENDGVFSAWNGQSPTKRLPTRLSARCSPISETRSVASRTRATSSSTIPNLSPALRRISRRRDYGGKSHAVRKILRTPSEDVDAEREREPIGQPAHVSHRERGSFRGTWLRCRDLAVANHGHPARRVGEMVDEPSEQVNRAVGLAARR